MNDERRPVLLLAGLIGLLLVLYGAWHWLARSSPPDMVPAGPLPQVIPPGEGADPSGAPGMKTMPLPEPGGGPPGAEEKGLGLPHPDSGAPPEAGEGKKSS